ncbi:hypothetical protein G7Y89_g11154 [Cudoniella acicularis]|uniref:N-acetyltransferase domain-containing protein n=1 Tax=Cudoniella acicularis TaxID=354080 RepID=A0A8H4RBE5_9HELO|nr:hypothetical protein G7Y89_g11154 [Cudoniella acicularis]
MAIELSPVEDGDWRTITDVNMDTFHEHEHPVIDIMFPHHHTPAGRDIMARRLQQTAKSDASGHHLKLTDTAAGKIIGQGRWAIVPPQPGNEYPAPVISGDYWASEEDVEFANWCIGAYTAFRRRKFREATRPVFAITSLTVLPEYEGRGAGSMFVRWGTEQADAIGSECIVESGIRAESFYAKHGFERIEHVHWPPPEKWRHYGTQEVPMYIFLSGERIMLIRLSGDHDNFDFRKPEGGVAKPENRLNMPRNPRLI